MRQGPNGRRPRGRHHNGGHGGNGNGNGGGMPNPNNPNRQRSAAALRHQTFDSHCLDVRVRGNAWQVYEKYQALARDAQGSGDRVSAENYLQHAEHYYRIIEAINEATALEQRQRGITPTPFGEQPATPANYYGADGSIAPPPAQPDGAAQPPQAAQAPAEVQQMPQRPAQQQQDPFFAQEEAEDQNAPEPLAARR